MTTPSTTPAIGWSDLEPIWSAVSSSLNAESIVGILAGAAGACVALVLLWWGIRKVTGMIMSAFKKGRLTT